MSTFKVPLTTVRDLLPHPNADRLEIAKIYDWDVIVAKDQYKVGDPVIYVPIDSILPLELEMLLFPEGSKIKLHKSRVKSIKIRGSLSQGMLINPKEISMLDDMLIPAVLDDNLAEALGITKFEPPASSVPNLMQTNQPTNPYKVKEFKEYTDIEHGKYYDRVILDGELVVITCKLHGTSARYGWFKRKPIGLLDKCLNWLGLMPEWIFCWGSRRSQIQAKPGKKHPGFNSDSQGVRFGDVYTKMKHQYNLEYKIPKGYSVYGEIVGDGIQKNYKYGCKSNEHKFYVYDVMYDGKWLNPEDMYKFCLINELMTVPLMYRGPYSKAKVEELLTVNALGTGEVNEGVVVKPVVERSAPSMGRVVLKWINSKYYEKDQTDFH